MKAARTLITTLALAASAALVLTPVGASAAARTASAHTAAAHTAAAHTATGQVSQRRGCGDIDEAAYAPIGGGWSRTYKGQCGHIDTHHSPYIYVSWEVAFGDGEACARAIGYKWADGKPYWASLGCGTSGTAKVHWGQTGHEIIGVTQVQVKSLNVVTGVPTYFTD